MRLPPGTVRGATSAGGSSRGGGVASDVRRLFLMLLLSMVAVTILVARRWLTTPPVARPHGLHPLSSRRRFSTTPRAATPPAITTTTKKNRKEPVRLSHAPSPTAAGPHLPTTLDADKTLRRKTDPPPLRRDDSPPSAETSGQLAPNYMGTGSHAYGLSGRAAELFSIVALRHGGPSLSTQRAPESGGDETSSLATVTDRRAAAPPQTPFPCCAFVLVVSNEEYVDGSLVMAVSLRWHSAKLQRGEAHLVVVATQGRLGKASRDRLVGVGTVDVVFEVPSLALRAPKAHLKDTFDKSYIFALTMYKKIVFLDADMIVVGKKAEFDSLFEKAFGEVNELGAIGFRGMKKKKRHHHGKGDDADDDDDDSDSDDYFQTGMMVIQPSWTMFDAIMAEFAKGTPPRGNFYNQPGNGRDGVLLRNVFKSRFHEISNQFSRNLNPRFAIPEDVYALHLRGSHKPWYNKLLPNADPLMGKKEFGFPYLRWWDIYEERIHKTSPEYLAAMAGTAPRGGELMPAANDDEASERKAKVPYGGRDAGPGVTPLTHVWMMRNTTREYAQLTSWQERAVRDGTMPGEVVLLGEEGQSCDQTCEGHRRLAGTVVKEGRDDGGAGATYRCSLKSLFFSKFQNCQYLAQIAPQYCGSNGNDNTADANPLPHHTAAAAPTAACELAVYWKPHMGSDYPAVLTRPNKDDHRQVGYEQLKKYWKLVDGGNSKKKWNFGGPVCRFNLLLDERSRPTCEARNETTRRFCPCVPM